MRHRRSEVRDKGDPGTSENSPPARIIRWPGPPDGQPQALSQRKGLHVVRLRYQVGRPRGNLFWKRSTCSVPSRSIPISIAIG